MQSFSGEMDQFYFTLKGEQRGPAPAPDPATGICTSEHGIMKYVYFFFYVYFFINLSLLNSSCQLLPLRNSYHGPRLDVSAVIKAQIVLMQV